MKKISLLIICLSVAVVCFSQKWEFASRYGNGFQDYGFTIGLDKYNNSYITAVNSSPSSGPNQGFRHQLLYKFDATGNWLWTDTLDPVVTKSVTDKEGNTYIIGKNALIAKYNSTGQKLWQQYIANAPLTLIALKPTGGILVGGHSYNGAPMSFGTTTLTGKGGFVADCDISGNWQWAFNDSAFSAYDITISFNNNIYLAGSGLNDFNVRKYNSNGIFEAEVGQMNVAVSAISVDFKENIYLMNGIGGTDKLILDGTIYQTQYGFSNTFIISYNKSGALRWVKQFKGDHLGGLVKNGSNNMLYYSGNILKNLVVDNYNLDNLYSQLFISKIDTSGNVLWIKTSVRSAQQNFNDFPYAQLEAMVLDADNNAFITGSFVNNIKFDDKEIGFAQFSSYSDLFIAKLSDSKTTSTIPNPTELNVFGVYPNPSNGEFYLTANLSDSTSVEIMMYDVLGRMLTHEKYNNIKGVFQKQFYVNEASGVYILNVITNKGSFIHKVIKQ
ncbi:MAG: T9SS type A sorting domain-containing protein [Bacteroidetes bacterium]|nr:T9SS type A sorting domain-containing protein [Bacteroidota bacterium]